MERPRRQGASQDRRQPQKKRRPSPLPGAPPDRAGSRSGVSRPCRRRLFGNAGPPGPQPGSLKGRSCVKSLPKIKENLEVSQVNRSCNQSNQVNVQETIDLEKKEEKMEESTVSVKESLIINFESKESLKNPEVTSSTGMTLPTGVSTFLLQCLDEDSTADYNTGSSGSLNSCLSPETFRNNISEPVLEDFQDQYARRKRPSNCNYSSSLNVSTTVAGKKVCKITAARERTPDLKTGMRCSSPLGPARKPLCGRREICCIVRTSPCRRPPSPHQTPVNTKAFSPPEGVPEGN
ncbi:Meikin [Columba guinea]|nr:Meikin [Columba guinea]